MSKQKLISICNSISDWFDIVKMAEKPENESIKDCLMQLAMKKYSGIPFEMEILDYVKSILV